MTALTIHSSRQLPASLLATLKRANIEFYSIPNPDNEEFSHLHTLTTEQEEQAFKEATRANQRRFWNRNSHLL
jgi:hypothetical protein